MINQNTILSALAGLALLMPPALLAADETAAPLSVQIDNNGLKEILWKGKNYAMPSKVRLTHLNVPEGDKVGNALGAHLGNVADPTTGTVTADYTGAKLQCRYQVDGNRLDLFVEITNKTDKPVLNFNAELAKLDLLPTLRNMASDLVGVPRNIDNIGRVGMRRLEADGATLALINWEISPTAVVNVGTQTPSGPFPLVLSLPQGKNGQHPIVDNRFFVQPGREIAPGSTEKFHISLTFADPAATDEELSANVNARIAKQYPMVLEWKDRRPIGTLFLANPATGWKTNPRGYLPGKGKDNDITTEEGLQAFGAALMAYADHSIEILKEANAQGVILWDLEGAEHHHPITYIAQPDKLGKIAPEMDRFADALFKKFRDAGLKTGITLRPTEVVPDPQKPGKWTHIEVKDPVKLLDAKITYAKKRWGCTIFYLDSNVFGNDWLTEEQKKQLQGVNWVMPTQMLAALMKKHPEILIIPEWSGWQDYRYSAPYSAVGLGMRTTSPRVRATYPTAFKVMSTSTRALEQDWDTYLQGVSGGDVFLFNAWYRGKEIGLLHLLLAEAEIRKMGPPDEVTQADADALIKILSDPQENLRLQYHAISALGERGTPASAQALARFLDSPNLLLRRSAIIALGKLPGAGTPDLAAAMDRILRDPNSQMLAPAASKTLGRFGAVSQGQIAALLGEAKKPELVSHGVQAARSLPEADPVISAKLMELLATDNVALRETAIAALGELKVREAVPQLIALLSDKQENVSRLAVLALGQIGDRSAVPPILDLYNRQYKTMALYSIRETQDAALKSLVGDKTSRTRDEWRAYFAQTKP